MSVSFTCTVVLLTYIPALCVALHEGTGMPDFSIDNMLCDTAQLMRAKGRNVKCPNHRGICTANLDRTDVFQTVVISGISRHRYRVGFIKATYFVKG
jgi:uncharacterized membrane protein YqaE (UPF0057 family)